LGQSLHCEKTSFLPTYGTQYCTSPPYIAQNLAVVVLRLDLFIQMSNTFSNFMLVLAPAGMKQNILAKYGNQQGQIYYPTDFLQKLLQGAVMKI